MKIFRSVRARRARLSARRAARNGDWSSAAIAYRGILQMGVATARDRMQFAHALKESGDAASAEKAYWSAAAAAPRHFEAQLQYGLFLKHLQKYDEAAGVLARAISLKPGDTFVISELAHLGFDGETFDLVSLTGILGGGNTIRNRLRLADRLTIFLRLRRARTYSREHHWAAASREYDHILAIDPDNQRLLVQRGHALREQGDAMTAAAIYRNALIGDPRNADTYLYLGHAFKAIGNTAGALHCYLTAWRLQPDLPAVVAELYSFGWSNADLKRVIQQNWGLTETTDTSGSARASSRISMPDGLTGQQQSIWMLLAAHVRNRN